MNEPKSPKMGFEEQAAEQQARLGELLWDGHTAGSKVLEFTAGRTAADFAESELLQAVVTKMLEILAAALAELQQLAPDQAARIERLPALMDLQSHPASAVWAFVQQSLPGLLAEISAQLEDWHQG